jgi:hypothetical protein
LLTLQACEREVITFFGATKLKRLPFYKEEQNETPGKWAPGTLGTSAVELGWYIPRRVMKIK